MTPLLVVDVLLEVVGETGVNRMDCLYSPDDSHADSAMRLHPVV